MKISTKITGVIVFLTLFSVGCSGDFLEELPESQISADVFYDDALSTEIGLTGVYNRFFNENAYPGIVVTTQVGTDDIKQPFGAYFQYKQRDVMLASNANTGVWENLYETIVNANFLLEQ